jgi:hypothetical protein
MVIPSLYRSGWDVLTKAQRTKLYVNIYSNVDFAASRLAHENVSLSFPYYTRNTMVKYSTCAVVVCEPRDLDLKTKRDRFTDIGSRY